MQTKTNGRFLPEGWQWLKLGDICEFTYGESLPARARQSDGKVPVYGSNGIVGFHNEAVTSSPTIIIGRKGSIGEVHFSEVGCFPIDTTYYIERTKIDADLIWLFYGLKFLKLQNLNRAAAIPGLNRDDAYALEIPLPPLHEQRRIASRLNEQLAAVESARKAAEEQLHAAWELPSAYLREIFDDDLVQKYPKKALDDVCSFITDGTHVTPTYVPTGVPFLSVKDVKETGLRFDDCRYISQEEHETLTKRCKPVRGDVLYTKVGTTGIAKAIDVDREFSIFVSVALLKLKNEIITPEYLERVLNSPFCRVQADNLTQGMANQNLVLKDLKRIELPLPPLEEQKKVTKLIAEKLSSAQLVIDALESQLIEINRLPASLLRGAFAGQ